MRKETLGGQFMEKLRRLDLCLDHSMSCSLVDLDLDCNKHTKESNLASPAMEDRVEKSALRWDCSLGPLELSTILPRHGDPLEYWE